MRNKAFCLFIILTALLLSGCSGPDVLLKKQMTEESGILEDTNYQQYEQYKAAGRLDTDGNYTEEEPSPEETEHAGAGNLFNEQQPHHPVLQ